MKLPFTLLICCFVSGQCFGQASKNPPATPALDAEIKAANASCLEEYARTGGRAHFCNLDGSHNPDGKSVFVWYTHNKGKRVPTAPLFKLRNIKKLLLYPDRVGALRLDGPILFDDDLKGISGMKGLEQLLISGEFSNAALEHLSKLPDLRTLWIADTRITGAKLSKLKSLNSLETLHVDSAGLKVENFKELKGLPNLRFLEIYNAEEIETELGEFLPNASVNHRVPANAR